MRLRPRNQSWVEARNAYERALERDPGNDEARRGLAIANERVLPPPDRGVAAEEPPEPTSDGNPWARRETARTVRLRGAVRACGGIGACYERLLSGERNLPPQLLRLLIATREARGASVRREMEEFVRRFPDDRVALTYRQRSLR